MTRPAAAKMHQDPFAPLRAINPHDVHHHPDGHDLAEALLLLFGVGAFAALIFILRGLGT